MTEPANPTATVSATEPHAKTQKSTHLGAWVALLLALASAALAWGAWTLLAPAAKLDEAGFFERAGAGRFDEAESLLRTHLKRHRDDTRAKFLLAQLLVERPDRVDSGAQSEDAAEALELLDAIAESPPTKSPDSPAVRQYYRGKADYARKHWDAAEAAWLEALRLDPTVPEAGFALLDLYYLQLRRRDGRELALKLFETEPDPGDRVKLLTALLFLDAVKPDPSSLVPILEGVAQADPRALISRAALGLALVRANQLDRGVQVLKTAARDASDKATDSRTRQIVVEDLLTGLDQASRADELKPVLDTLSESDRENPIFARFFGLEAQHRGDWPAAITAYERALKRDPSDFETRARLSQAMRFASREAESQQLTEALARERETVKGLIPLHDQLAALPASQGLEAEALFARAAAAYEAMTGRAEEQAAWHRVLEDAATTK